MRARLGLASLLGAVASIVTLAAPQTLDRASTSTAKIGGVVVDDQTRQPIRRARVTLTPILPLRRSIDLTTDEDGRFVFAQLAAGRYVLSAEAPHYLQRERDATLPISPGVPFDVADGATTGDIVLPLTRSAVIGGVITNHSGEAVIDASVGLLRWGFSSRGERMLVGAPIAYGTTDDRGRYRIHGVPPGEYFVAADGERQMIDGPSPNPARDQDVQVLRHEDVAAARRGDVVVAMRSKAAPPIMAKTYYPGVTRGPDAVAVVVGPGDERTDIDFVLRDDPVATVRGTIVMPAGRDARRPYLSLQDIDIARGFRQIPATISGESFTFAGVPPGDYVAIAFSRSVEQSASPGSEPDRQGLLFGMLEIRVDGRDVSDLVLNFVPGATVSGRATLVGGPSAPNVPNPIRIGLTPISYAGMMLGMTPPATLDPSGAFVIASAPPGRYVLEAASDGLRSWFVKSAVVGGRDVTDVPFELEGGATVNAVVTLTNLWAELSGSVRTASGAEPPPGGWVVVCATDRATWRPASPRVRSTRVAADGKFRITNLPAGDYHVALVDGLEPGQLWSTGFLDQAVSASPVRVTLGDGERKTQDLVIR